MIPLVIVGAGGHGKDVLAIVEAINDAKPTYDFLGFLDDNRKGPGILGTVGSINDYDEAEFVIGINDGKIRRRIANMANGSPATLVHPSAIIGDCVAGFGCVLAADVVLTTGVKIGDHTHINVGSTVSQSSTLGSFVTVGPGAHIAGAVEIGDLTTIGIGAVVVNVINIGANTMIGAGAVVTKDIPGGVTAVGCPARVLQRGYVTEVPDPERFVV